MHRVDTGTAGEIAMVSSDDARGWTGMKRDIHGFENRRVEGMVYTESTRWTYRRGSIEGHQIASIVKGRIRRYRSPKNDPNRCLAAVVINLERG